MSDGALTVGIVAEGPTDHVILNQVAQVLLGDELRVLPIQPEASDAFGGFGRHGRGWTGVRRWCEDTAASSGGVLTYMSSDFGPQIEILVVHVDADIAADPQIKKERPCPPAASTVNELRKVLSRWIGLGAIPSCVVLAIPSKSTEAWIVAALTARSGRAVVGIECRRDPARSLTRRPHKYLDNKHGKAQKEQAVYRDLLGPVVAEHWGGVRGMCGEAERFSREFLAAVKGRPKVGD